VPLELYALGLIYLDEFDVSGNYFTGPSAGLCDADVYVFYVGEEAKIITSHAGQSNVESVDLLNPADWDNPCIRSQTKDADGIWWYPSDYTAFNNIQPHFTITASTKFADAVKTLEIADPGSISRTRWSYEDEGYTWLRQFASSRIIYKNTVIRTEEAQSFSDSLVEQKFQTLVVPFFDRESFYIYEFEYDVAGTSYNLSKEVRRLLDGPRAEGLFCSAVGEAACWYNIDPFNDPGGCLVSPSSQDRLLSDGSADCCTAGSPEYEQFLQLQFPVGSQWGLPADSTVSGVTSEYDPKESLTFFGNGAEYAVYTNRSLDTVDDREGWGIARTLGTYPFIGSYPDAFSSAVIAGRLITTTASPILMKADVNGNYPAVCGMPRVKRLLWVGGPKAGDASDLSVCEEDL